MLLSPQFEFVCECVWLGLGGGVTEGLWGPARSF